MLSWEDFDQDETFNNQAENTAGQNSTEIHTKEKPQNQDPLRGNRSRNQKRSLKTNSASHHRLGITRH